MHLGGCIATTRVRVEAVVSLRNAACLRLHEMKDSLPRNYDAWRTRSQEDEEEEVERQRELDQRRMDKAEHDRERKKDGE